MQIKILTYNIHKGLMAGRCTIENIRSTIQFCDADIVFLQEVRGEQSRPYPLESAEITHSQFEALADEMWPHFAYGKNAVYSAGHHGNAILSKFPLRKWENIDISCNPFAKRGLLHGVIEIPAESSTAKTWDLHAICLHLDLDKKSRLAQANLIAQRLNEHVPADQPLVVAGDLNDWGRSLGRRFTQVLGLKEAFKEKTGRYAKTFPAVFPTLTLDRIYFRNFQVDMVKKLSGKPYLTQSDHLPLMAALTKT